MKKIVLIGFVFIVLMSSLVSADYFYSPMNFDKSINHTFDINLNGNISVTLPPGFNLTSGALNGYDNLSFIIQSPNLTSDKPELYVGTIYLNGSKYEDFYFLGLEDSKIVDTKVEIGHGDFNYIEGDSYIGTDNTLLFDLVRIWAMGSDIIGKPARDVRFNCTYPLIIPNTVDSKYKTTYTTNNIDVEGTLSRMEGISMFRVFVLSQEVEYPENSSYEVSCDKLYYDFPHTQVIADIPNFNLSVRNTNPLKIDMNNNSGYITYTILNDELYNLKDLEFVWTIGTNTIREELGSLNSGDLVQYDIPTNASGDINFKVRFIPQWMFNSRSPLYYEQSSFDTYYAPEFLDGLNTNEYYTNQSVDSTPILETQVMDFSIRLLQNSPYGGPYKVTYLFYDENGVLQDEVERQIIGVDDHQISFSSLELNPSGLEEDYDVYTIVSVKDEEGEWYDFPEEFIGIQTLASLTDNGAKSQIGLYDVIVTNRIDRAEENDKITADILIKNTGDTPDEDTVLTYYLIGPDGERFGETKEQLYEVPPGSTVLTRSISLPVNSNLGEWEFHADYETVVQPTIQVYDSFEVVTGMSVLERGSIKLDNFSKYGWYFIWGIIGILVILVIWLSGRRKRK